MNKGKEQALNKSWTEHALLYLPSQFTSDQGEDVQQTKKKKKKKEKRKKKTVLRVKEETQLTRGFDRLQEDRKQMGWQCL